MAGPKAGCLAAGWLGVREAPCPTRTGVGARQAEHLHPAVTRHRNHGGSRATRHKMPRCPFQLQALAQPPPLMTVDILEKKGEDTRPRSGETSRREAIQPAMKLACDIVTLAGARRHRPHPGRATGNREMRFGTELVAQPRD